MTNTIYVTVTDKTMSGWGKAANKINKLVFVCDSREEADIVERNARNRGDMKHINMSENMPRYSPRTHYTQIKTKKEYPNWYNAGAF